MALGKRHLYSPFAKLRSNLSWLKPLPCRPVHQAYLLPTKPISIIPACKTNLFIAPKLDVPTRRPPTFHFGLERIKIPQIKPRAAKITIRLL